MKPLPKLIFACLFVALICGWAFFVSACGYAERIDPPVYTFANDKITAESARLHAKDADGWVTTITCCGSMKPLIQDGDRVVIVATPYGDRLKGRVAVYAPAWAKGGRVAHRLVAGSAAEGFIASGDNNARSEPQERVTAANYLGEIVAIYRTTP